MFALDAKICAMQVTISTCFYKRLQVFIQYVYKETRQQISRMQGAIKQDPSKMPKFSWWIDVYGELDETIEKLLGDENETLLTI